MRATSIGHAGILIETRGVSILCDPWFVPAFFGSWFPFPRNDRLSDDLLERIEQADFLYVSHLHGDHHDTPWLTSHLPRDIPILLPDFPTREQRRTLADLGFTEFVRTVDTEEVEIAPGVRVAIHIESSITDGPGGDSAIVVLDGESILVNQNDCRTNDLTQLRAHGPVDLHWLQFSGAIWYPMVYEMSDTLKRALCEAKVDSQFARAMRYVENVDARAVVPSAGPPCFLDDDLFALNMIDGDEMSIFPDQREFLRRLDLADRTGLMNIPGTMIEVTSQTIEVTHPVGDAELAAIFDDKRAYLEQYRADWKPWLDDQKASWNPPTTDLVATLQEWWQPLLEMAPTLRAQVGSNVLLRAGDLEVLIDFPAGRVRPYHDEPYAFRFDIARELVETVVAQRAVDWSNSLLLSCRFTAWREGEFNEYVYNFFKSLSRERMRRAEAEVVRKLDPDPEHTRVAEADIRIGDYVVQRRCPHRNADLAAFGEIDGDELVCTLHGWRFDVETGRCLTAADQPIRIRRAAPGSSPNLPG
jgi:UDP-MurNAc hydroxylase